MAAVIRKAKTEPVSKAAQSRQTKPPVQQHFDWPILNIATGQVSLPRYEYLGLLIEANATDPALWPKGLKKGARLLARIRRIETDCIKRFGEFDWEKLDPDTQDAYDGSRGELNKLRQDPKEPLTSWDDLKRKIDARVANANK